MAMHGTVDAFRDQSLTIRSPDNPQFWIARHVHVCVTPDGSVVLDLKRDKYLGFGREQTEILSTAVNSWPFPSWPCDPDRLDWGAARLLCESLQKDGMLTIECEPRNLINRAPIVDMKAELISVGDEVEIAGRVRVGHVTQFFGSYLWARCSLAHRSFLSIVEAIRSRKASRAGADYAYDIFRLAKMVDIFRQLRPYVFAAEGRCLLHALTLIRFLSRYDFYPEWVIGVVTQPWGAHSWVQRGNFLLDTNPEKVCQYTPILVV
jgi:hypothetical protein